MPVYEFICKECGKECDIRCKYDERGEQTCPLSPNPRLSPEYVEEHGLQCGGELEPIIPMSQRTPGAWTVAALLALGIGLNGCGVSAGEAECLVTRHALRVELTECQTELRGAYRDHSERVFTLIGYEKALKQCKQEKKDERH